MLVYVLDGPGSILGVGWVEIFLYNLPCPKLVLGSTQPPVERVPLSSAVAENMWTLASTSPVRLHDR